MTHAREHALPAAPTCSRSDAIQSSGKPGALQNTAAPPPKFGVLALATALDDAGSGTRNTPSQPLPRVPAPTRSQSSGKPEALQNIAAPPPKFVVLALAIALNFVGPRTRSSGTRKFD